MALDLTCIQGLCFDVDGTLNDTDDQFVLKLARWLHPFRFLFGNRDPKPFSRRMVMLTESSANFLFGLPDRLGIDDEIAAMNDAIYRKGLGKSQHPFAIIGGVQIMLENLSRKYLLSIVSARGQRTTQMFIDQFNLSRFFRGVATAQTCAHTKPYPDPVLWAAKQMGLAPENCLMIGDTTVDIRAGKAAGAQTVGVLCGFGTRAELEKAGADLIIITTSELTNHLLLENSS
jgi:phosphoglycolate phosphatase-like HAD superfamily hydrolase